MVIESKQLNNELIEVIPLHFDVPYHHLPLDDFIDTAKKTEAILDSFNQRLFDGKLKYKIMVLPPKNGCFIEILGYIGQGIGIIWAYSLTDGGKEFFKKLTGNEPSYWHGKAGEKVRAIFSKKQPEEQKNVEVSEELIKQQAEAMMLIQVILSFMQMDEEALTKLGINPRKFREAFEARNEFYTTCNANIDIKGIGFKEAHKFPIKRSDFAKLQVKLPPKEAEDEQLDWIVGVERIVVPGPIWQRELQDRRHWFGIYGDNKEATFIIEDESFWRRRDDGTLHLQPNDHLKVQWVFIEKRGKRTKYRVLRVLEFNDDYLADELSDDILDVLLRRYEQEDKRQGDFLEWRE